MKQHILLKDISQVLFLFMTKLAKGLEIVLFHLKRLVFNMNVKILWEKILKFQWENVNIQPYENNENNMGQKYGFFELFCSTKKKGLVIISELSFPVLNFCISFGLGPATPRSASSFMFLG